MPWKLRSSLLSIILRKCLFISVLVQPSNIEETRYYLSENKCSLKNAKRGFDLPWCKLASCELCNCSWQLSVAEFICSVKHPINKSAAGTPAIRKLYFLLLAFSKCFKSWHLFKLAQAVFYFLLVLCWLFTHVTTLGISIKMQIWGPTIKKMLRILKSSDQKVSALRV